MTQLPTESDSYKRIFTLPSKAKEIFCTPNSLLLEELTKEDLSLLLSASFESSSSLPSYISQVLCKFTSSNYSLLIETLMADSNSLTNLLIQPHLEHLCLILLLNTLNKENTEFFSYFVKNSLNSGLSDENIAVFLSILSILAEIKQVDQISQTTHNTLVNEIYTVLESFKPDSVQKTRKFLEILIQTTRLNYRKPSVSK